MNLLGKIGSALLTNLHSKKYDSFEIFRDIQLRDSAETFSKPMTESTLIRDKTKLHEYVLLETLRNCSQEDNGIFAEFGVHNGGSINGFARILQRYNKKIYGFDSFEGIEENWKIDVLKGVLNRNGKPPVVEPNVELLIGKAQDTLPGFIKKNVNSYFSFIHLDMDTYTPTKFTLEILKPFLKKNSVI